MNRKTLNRFSVAIGAVILASCSQQKIEWKPTYAAQLGTGGLTVADLVGAQESEIQGDTFTQGGNEIYSYKLVYVDTLEPVTIGRFGSFNSGDNVPAIPNPQGVALPENNTLLRVTGAASGGEFQFTRPTVTFDFYNEINMDVVLRFDNTFTRNVKTNVDTPFSITSPPTKIPAGSIGSPSSAQLVVENANTNNALTNVFSPTPKFLFYTPYLGTDNGTNSVNDGELTVVSTVTLPFTGYGKVFYRDTVPLNSGAENGIKDTVPVGNSELRVDGGVEFAFLRFNFQNEIPLNVRITANLVDSSTYAFIDQVRFYDIVDGEEGIYPYTIIEAGSLDVIKQKITEMRLYRNNPGNGRNEIDAVLNGSSIIFELEFDTPGHENGDEVTMRSEQTLSLDVAFKTKLNGELETPSLLDIVR